MKKVLIVFDGTSFSKGAFEFAKKLNEIDRIFLTGIFIPQLSYTKLWSYTGAMNLSTLLPSFDNKEDDQTQTNIEKFQKLCEAHQIQYNIHQDYYDFALPELKKETRFADLLVLGGEKFYDDPVSSKGNEHLKDTLHASECPVIVIPGNFIFPEEVILAYDGSNSSVYAIKQFAYLFPFLTTKHTILAYSSDDGAELPDKKNITELVSKHYPNLSIQTIDKDQQKFTTWIKSNKSALLVSGSFGRSAISLVLKDSFVVSIIKDQQIPVFIAHR